MSASTTQTKEQQLRIILEYLESINESIHVAARDARYLYFRTEDAELVDSYKAIWNCCDTIKEHVGDILYIIQQERVSAEQKQSEI
jgi:hypothetical protein